MRGGSGHSPGTNVTRRVEGAGCMTAEPEVTPPCAGSTSTGDACGAVRNNVQLARTYFVVYRVDYFLSGNRKRSSVYARGLTHKLLYGMAWGWIRTQARIGRRAPHLSVEHPVLQTDDSLFNVL